jgi:ribosome-binding factor A
MAGFKLGRITQDIHRELSAILRELKDPRIAPMLSIVKVQVSNDLSYAKVYVSAIEGMEKTKESVVGLKSASGFIRRELSNRLHLRKCPELSFIADDSIAYGAQINRMLEELHPAEEVEEESEE